MEIDIMKRYLRDYSNTILLPAGEIKETNKGEKERDKAA